ncbi:MAG TPA: F0F1 ATP synthase subunit delta [Blastocatellia bacterium]|nr:F0F1 ATP synthase subunit delta [Blastocatellia bacterium]
MKTTKQIRREARQLFRLCLVDGFLDELRVRQVVRGVLESGRRGGQAVLSRFLRLVKLDVAEHTAAVESATSLPADLQADVLAGVERVYGPRMNSSFSLNPALIGGMRIRVASDVYDSSVKARLAELERRF